MSYCPTVAFKLTLTFISASDGLHDHLLWLSPGRGHSNRHVPTSGLLPQHSDGVLLYDSGYDCGRDGPDSLQDMVRTSESIRASHLIPRAGSTDGRISLRLAALVRRVALSVSCSCSSSLASYICSSSYALLPISTNSQVQPDMQLVQVVTSVGSVNAKIELNIRSTFAFTIYQYISSSIVVSPSSALCVLFRWLTVLSQGLYPTIIVLLVHSKHSILRSQAETSRTAVVFKQARGAGESRTAYSTANTATFTSGPVHVMTDDADVYEMASTKTAGTGDSDEHLEKGLRVQMQRSAPYVD